MHRTAIRNLSIIACASLQIALTCPVWGAPRLIAQAAGTSTAYATPTSGMNKILQGRASMTKDTWLRYYNAGTHALDKRLFNQAEPKLLAALNELRRKNVQDVRLVQTKEALGRTLLGLERYDDAERYLTDAVMRAGKLGSLADGAKARASAALAETLLARDKVARAEAVAREAVVNCEKSGVNELRSLGRAYVVLGDALRARGLDADAEEAYKKSIAVLEHDGLDEYDLAHSQYRLGLLLNAMGDHNEAAALVGKALSTFDKEALLNRPLYTSPRLVMKWEEGNPRARVVPDQDYPLKYVTVDGVRVAATLVRSENVIVALISLANCSRNRKELSVGHVSLRQLAPKDKDFRWVHPHELDVVLEAEHITELTWRRRWLNHIQKTRRIPGYLKDGVLDVDNFFGNNTFGTYGNWQTVARSETPIVTREQFLYSPYRENPNDGSAADFLSQTPAGTRPTYLDAGDAKTGLVYFQQERFDKALLKIVLGNAVIEIPFDSAGPR